MTIEDKRLLDVYHEGFNDCFDNIDKEQTFEITLERQAYRLGWNHSIIGDDVRSVDYLSIEETLKRIKSNASC